MSTVVPVLDTAIPRIPRLIWRNASTGDTFVPFAIEQQYGLAAGVQVIGTFGGATVTLEVSNDGDNWVTAKTLEGDLATFFEMGYAELSLSAAYIRPKIEDGSSDDLTIIAVLRGSNAL